MTEERQVGGVIVKRLTGDDLFAAIPDLARLRIEVFRDFPYLYDGDLDYERGYLETYVRSPESVLVAALDGERVIGASTALPLVDEADYVIAPFDRQGIDPATVFYFGESVLTKGYRGRGLGVAFFEEREAWARSLGRFEWAAFCAVERPADHPRRSADYVPLDDFWCRRGFAPVSGMDTWFEWKDLDEAEASAKRMLFWTKHLTS